MDPDRPRREHPRPVNPAPATPGARLLLVDDDRLILATLGEGLREAGFEVCEATDGEGALALARKAPPDLAILDLRMPGPSGVQVARELRALGAPCIFLSAYGEDADVAAAAREGALSYLVKPVDVPQLLAAVRTALVRARELRELEAKTWELDRALAGNREISMAVGLLMERFRLEEREAFNTLRDYARCQRRRVAEVARAVVRSTESLNALGRGLAGKAGKGAVPQRPGD